MPKAATVGAMSSTIGGSSPAGIAIAMGLVPSRFSSRAPGRQVVVAADREIEPDHVVGERHRGVERRRAGVVAHARARPRRRLLPWPSRSRSCVAKRMTRWPMPLSPSTSAVARLLLHDADIRTRLDAAGLQPAQIERQADHAVGIAAAQIGLDHEAGDDPHRFRGRPAASKARLMNAVSAAAWTRGTSALAVWFVLCDGLLGHFPSGLLCCAMSSRSKADYNSILRRRRRSWYGDEIIG